MHPVLWLSCGPHSDFWNCFFWFPWNCPDLIPSLSLWPLLSVICFVFLSTTPVWCTSGGAFVVVNCQFLSRLQLRDSPVEKMHRMRYWGEGLAQNSHALSRMYHQHVSVFTSLEALLFPPFSPSSSCMALFSYYFFLS